MIIAIIIFAVVMFHLLVGLGYMIYKVVKKPSTKDNAVESESASDANLKS